MRIHERSFEETLRARLELGHNIKAEHSCGNQAVGLAQGQPLRYGGSEPVCLGSLGPCCRGAVLLAASEPSRFDGIRI